MNKIKFFIVLVMMVGLILPAGSILAAYNTVAWSNQTRLYFPQVAPVAGAEDGISINVYADSFLHYYYLDVSSLRLQMRNGSKVYLESADRKLFNAPEGYPATECTDKYSRFAYESNVIDPVDFTITFTDGANCPPVATDVPEDGAGVESTQSVADAGKKINLFDLTGKEEVESLVKNDQVGFIINGILETVTVESVASAKATVSLSKLGKTLYLNAGHGVNVDVDADGYRDARLSLKRVGAGGADISFEPLKAVKLNEAKPRDLIKTAASSEVFYVAEDSRLYVFPNADVYYSWYPDFSAVKTVSVAIIDQFSQGGLITYRPGYKLVTFATTNDVFAVAKNGELRKLKDEQMAAALYGSDWNKKVADINSAFAASYKIGASLESSSAYDLDAALTLSPDITVDKGI